MALNLPNIFKRAPRLPAGTRTTPVTDQRLQDVYGNNSISDQLGPGTPAPAYPLDASGKPRQRFYRPGWDIQANPDTDRGISFLVLREVADLYFLLRKCVDIRKEEISHLEWDVVPRYGTPMEKRDQMRAKKDQIKALKKFMLKPDGRLGWQDWVRTAIEDVLVVDALSIYKQRSLGGTLQGLELIDGTLIRPLINLQGRRPLPPAIAYAQVIAGVNRFYFTTDELLYLPRNVRIQTPYGFGPVEENMGLWNFAMRHLAWITAVFTDGSIPQAMLSAPEGWQREQIEDWMELRKQIRAGDPRFQRDLEVAPHGMEAVIQNGGDNYLQFGSDMANWIIDQSCAVMDITRQELGLDPSNSGGLGGSGRADAQEGVQYRRSVLPLATWFAQALMDNVLGDFGLEDFKTIWPDLSEEDESARAELYTKKLMGGQISFDEMQIELGGEPIGVGHLLQSGGELLSETDLLLIQKLGWAGYQAKVEQDKAEHQSGLDKDAAAHKSGIDKDAAEHKHGLDKDLADHQHDLDAEKVEAQGEQGQKQLQAQHALTLAETEHKHQLGLAQSEHQTGLDQRSAEFQHGLKREELEHQSSLQQDQLDQKAGIDADSLQAQQQAAQQQAQQQHGLGLEAAQFGSGLKQQEAAHGATLDSAQQAQQQAAAYQQAATQHGYSLAQATHQAGLAATQAQTQQGYALEQGQAQHGHSLEQGAQSATQQRQNTQHAALWKAVEPDITKGGTGVMVALLIPQIVAEKIAVQGGEKPSELHITLAYCGKKADLTLDQQNTLLMAVKSVSKRHAPLMGSLAGSGEFPPSEHSDHKTVEYLKPHIPGLHELRADLVAELRKSGIPVADNFDFNPHITLRYRAPGAPETPPLAERTRIGFGQIFAVVGDSHHGYLLEGSNHRHLPALKGVGARIARNRTSGDFDLKIRPHDEHGYDDAWANTTQGWLQVIPVCFREILKGAGWKLTAELADAEVLYGEPASLITLPANAGMGGEVLICKGAERDEFAETIGEILWRVLQGDTPSSDFARVFAAHYLAPEIQRSANPDLFSSFAKLRSAAEEYLRGL